MTTKEFFKINFVCAIIGALIATCYKFNTYTSATSYCNYLRNNVRPYHKNNWYDGQVVYATGHLSGHCTQTFHLRDKYENTFDTYRFEGMYGEYNELIYINGRRVNWGLKNRYTALAPNITIGSIPVDSTLLIHDLEKKNILTKEMGDKYRISIDVINPTDISCVGKLRNGKLVNPSSKPFIYQLQKNVPMEILLDKFVAESRSDVFISIALAVICFIIVARMAYPYWKDDIDGGDNLKNLALLLDFALVVAFLSNFGYLFT